MKPFVIVVSGLSGAGKTVTLRALEDVGFFCVDNLPPSLIDAFIDTSTLNSNIEQIGIGIDIREKDLLKDFKKVILHKRDKYNLHTIFLDADIEALIRRYKETRRPHPLTKLAKGDIIRAIKIEEKLLKPLKDEADRLIDTSSLDPHQLRRVITSMFSNISVDTLKITLISFGFKFGIPQHLDMLLDVRFLPNPHFVDKLRPLTGLDDEVKRFVFDSNLTLEYIKKIEDLLDFLIPQYINEGKTYFTLGIGCTGGRHRSPSIVERLRTLLETHKIPIEVVHREL